MAVSRSGVRLVAPGWESCWVASSGRVDPRDVWSAVTGTAADLVPATPHAEFLEHAAMVSRAVGQRCGLLRVASLAHDADVVQVSLQEAIVGARSRDARMPRAWPPGGTVIAAGC